MIYRFSRMWLYVNHICLFSRIRSRVCLDFKKMGQVKIEMKSVALLLIIGKRGGRERIN
jgi:hypothetical protein